MKIIITESQLQTILQEDMVRLRTLTVKSIWDYSQKYKGWTVGELLKHHPSTLFWGYCKIEWLNFTEDILKVLSERFGGYFHIIPKPGIDPDQIDNFFNKANYSNKTIPELKKLITAKRINGQKVDLELINLLKNKEQNVRNAIRQQDLSKKTMQQINHGKKPF